MTGDSLQCLLDLLLLFLPADCTLPQNVYLLEKHSKKELDKPTYVSFCTSCLHDDDVTQEQQVFLCRTSNTQTTKQELNDKGRHYTNCCELKVVIYRCLSKKNYSRDI